MLGVNSIWCCDNAEFAPKMRISRDSVPDRINRMRDLHRDVQVVCKSLLLISFGSYLNLGNPDRQKPVQTHIQFLLRDDNRVIGLDKDILFQILAFGQILVVDLKNYFFPFLAAKEDDLFL
jgi:hypothetical protein